MNQITVLIVDDIANTREDIKRLLYFEDDIEVVGEARDGQEACALAAELRPDVILMDINMPRMDGIEATEHISVEVPESAIIIVSIQGEQEYLRKAMSAGAREYLIKPFTASELADSIRRVSESHRRRNLQLMTAKPATQPRKQAPRGKLITFFCTKGGVGKTTLASNLAVCLAQDTGKSVALLDLDLTAGDVTVMLNITARGTIADLVQEQDQIDFSLVDSFLVPHLSGAKILPAPASPEQAELVLVSHVEQIIKTLRDNLDYIIVDTSPLYSDINLAVLEGSDQVCLVLNQDLTSLRHVKSSLNILQTLSYGQRVNVLLNQHSSESGIKAADLEKTLSLSMAAIIPEDQKTVRTAINKGLPFVLTQANSKVSLSVRGLISILSLAKAEDMTNEPPKKSLVSRLFSF
ncbi:MAG: response regulator [Bacillota bacterium]